MAPKMIELKDAQMYNPVSIDEVKRQAIFFKTLTPESEALSDIDNLSCLEKKQPRSLAIAQKYLLLNKRTHEYFFHEMHLESDGF